MRKLCEDKCRKCLTAATLLQPNDLSPIRLELSYLTKDINIVPSYTDTV